MRLLFHGFLNCNVLLQCPLITIVLRNTNLPSCPYHKVINLEISNTITDITIFNWIRSDDYVTVSNDNYPIIMLLIYPMCS